MSHNKKGSNYIGAVFGEMALLMGDFLRHATIRARTVYERHCAPRMHACAASRFVRCMNRHPAHKRTPTHERAQVRGASAEAVGAARDLRRVAARRGLPRAGSSFFFFF